MKATKLTLEKKLLLLANNLGFAKVESYSKLYGTAINTFGRRDASMWFFTINITDKDLICGIEVNETYFKPSLKMIAIQNNCDFDKQITFEEAMNIVKKTKKGFQKK